MQDSLKETVSYHEQRSASPREALLCDLEDLASYYADRGLKGEDLSRAELTYMVALARYRVSRPDSRMLRERAHVMVFGGAGAGKSTTANILAGTNAADVNAQAGYTRHPTALFHPSADATPRDWPERLGTLSRIDRDDFGSLDEDRYGLRAVMENLEAPEFLSSHVVWDCPDLTTKDANHYESRVIEVAALADVCVYVASDERYNDELPTKFLQAVLETGTPTLVVLTKMSEFDAEQMVDHFRNQVVSKLHNAGAIVDIYPVPTPVKGKVADLWKNEFSHGSKLRELVESVTGDLKEGRREAQLATANYLWSRRTRLLDPLAKDVGQWRMWAELVRNAANNAVTRYEREYLDRQHEDDFHEARDALLNIFPLPGRGAYVWRTLEYLRVPYRALKAIARRFTDARTGLETNEPVLLDRIREQLIDSLLVTVATRRGNHGFWTELHRTLVDQGTLRCEPAFRELRARQERELRDSKRKVYEHIEKKYTQNPTRSWSLRIVRLAVDLSAVILGAWLGYYLIGYFSIWILLFVLAAVGIADDIVRIACQEFVRRERAALVRSQRENIRELIQTAYLDILVRLPEGLGGRLEQLSGVLERVPKEIAAQLDRLEPTREAK